MLRLLILVSLSLTALGCQSEEDAYRLLCNAPVDCEACRQGSPAERQQRLAEYIEERLSNSEVRRVIEQMASADPATRNAHLLTRTRELGITECPMLDSLQVDTVEAVAPPSDNAAPETP